MKRREGKQKGQMVRLRVWTRAEALTALPYIASVLRSVREHRLEANRQRRAARMLEDRPGRPGRTALIARQEAHRDAERADGQFEAAQAELQSLDIYCLDPIGGQALIPFVQDNQLAWFIYNLFDNEPLSFWRFQSDPLEMRRPISEVRQGMDEASVVV